MDDLISRQAAIDAGRHAWAKGLEPTQYLEELPSAQPERKTGKWIHGSELSREMIGDVVTAIFYEGWECSECHCLVSEEREPLWKYCPNCGTEMEGVQE